MKKNSVKNMLENEFDDVDEKSEVEINISEKIGQTNKIISGTGKSDTEFNSNPKIKEISDKLNSLKIPDKLPEPNSNEFKELKEKINRIILDMYSICCSDKTAKYKDLLKNQLLKNDESSKKLVSLFLDKLESFSSKIFDCKVNIDCFNQTTYNLGDIFDFLEQNKNLIGSSVQTKCSFIKESIMENKKNLLLNYLSDYKKNDYVVQALENFLEAYDKLNFCSEEGFRASCIFFFNRLTNLLNRYPEFQSDCIKSIHMFIKKLYVKGGDSVNKKCEQLDNFTALLEYSVYITKNKKIEQNILNDIVTSRFNSVRYLANNEYINNKFDYIDKKIDYFREEANKCTTANKDKMDSLISDIEIFEYNLRQLWDGCNELFHICRSNYINSKSNDDLNKYERIKRDRATLFNKFRKLETIKQGLLKQKIIIGHRNKFVPLNKCQKIFRMAVLILTFLIHGPIFILVKTLRKLLHCILMDLEVVHKVGIYLNDEIPVKKNCKDSWAEQCENGYFDELEINGQQISERIQWYETKRWLFWRRVLFPINFVVLIVIGIVLAIKKFFKSIIKVFITDYRIVKNILADDSTTYMFIDKSIFQAENSEIICNAKKNISVLPICENKNIKIRNKFVDMSCPRVSYGYFSDFKFWNNVQCAIGLKNIKSVDQWNEYAHEHHIPRLYCGGRILKEKIK